MSCEKLTYIKMNGKTSLDIIGTKLVICSMDYSNNINILSREISSGENKYLRPKKNYYGVSYSNNPTYNLTFMKSDCTSFTQDEQRKIFRWMTKNTLPTKLEIFNSKEWDSTIYFKIIVVDVESYRYNGTQLIKVSFELDSSFSYRDVKITKAVTANQKFVINVDSDLDDFGYIYPKITIIPKGTKVIVIKNLTDVNDANLNSFSYNGLQDLKTTIDCAKYIIKDNAGNVLRISDFFRTDNDNDVYWFRLLMDDNEIMVDSDCTMTFEFANMLKAGVPHEFNS